MEEKIHPRKKRLPYFFINQCTNIRSADGKVSDFAHERVRIAVKAPQKSHSIGLSSLPMKLLKSALIAAGLIGIFISSCKREELSWDLDVTVPIAHATLSLDDVLADSISSADADGSLRIVYHSKIDGLNTDTIFNIPDTTVVSSYHLPFGSVNLVEGSPLTNGPQQQTEYNLGALQLVYGVLEKGKMKLHMQNDVQKRVVVTYSIASATLNNVPLSLSFTLPAAPSATVASTLDAEVDLSGYTINFTGIYGDRVNTVTTLFTATIDPTDFGTVTVVPADSVIVNSTFSGVRPSYIRGYFGSENTPVGPEETYISFFSKVQSGQLGLDSLTMTFTLENYAGLDARFTVNNLWSRNSRLGQTILLNHPLIGNPININRASYSNTYPPSIPQIYSWRFDNSNSNVKSLIEQMPDYLGYDFSLYTNPLGNVSGNNDFLYTDFGINAYLDIDLPVHFFADQLVLLDTMETDFNSAATQDIQTARLKLFAGNGFPFDATLQIYLLDVNNNIYDSIVAAPGIILSAPLSTSGGYFFANGATQSQIDIPMNEVQTQAFLNSSRLVIKTKFATNTNPNYVKIFTTNKLDFNLTADFEYRVNN